MVEEVDYVINVEMPKQRRARQDKVMKEVLSSIPDKYHSTVKFKDITDLDDIRALNMVHYDTKDLHPLISRLKTEAMKFQLHELDEQLADEGSNFIPNSRSYGFLRSYQNHPDTEITRSARRILNSINAIVLDDMTRKYDFKTTAGMLDHYEKDALKTLRPKGEHDPEIHPVHLYLYWLIKENDLDSTIERFQADKKNYAVTEGFQKWLKFCSSGNVPKRMKDKAKNHLKKFGPNVWQRRCP